MILSQNDKVLNLFPPKAHANGFDGYSDIIDMSKYARALIIVATGVSSTSNSTLQIEALDALSASGNKTMMAFDYKYCDGTTDVHGAITTATSSGIAMTASKANSSYLIEVKASDVAAIGAAYKAIRLKATKDADNGQLVAAIAICYEGGDCGDALPVVQHAST